MVDVIQSYENFAGLNSNELAIIGLFIEMIKQLAMMLEIRL